MSDRLNGRTGEIWRAYVSGATQEQIAREHGITQQRVSQIIAEVRASIPAEDAAHIVQRELEFLDRMRVEVLAIVFAPPIPAYSNGRPILMVDGTAAEDHSGRLAAVDRAMRTHDRLVKLLGLDQATRHEITVRTSPDDIELVGRIRAWKAAQAVAFLAGEIEHLDQELPSGTSPTGDNEGIRS